MITTEFISAYFQGKRSEHYEKAVDIYNHISFHFDGYFRRANENILLMEEENPYFTRLIDMRRPSESDIIRNYRRDVYLPKTKAPCEKVANSLKKIVKSQDWCIDYSHSEQPPRLPENETLQYYCEKEYPYFGCVEAWAYMFGLNNMLKDPNAICMVLPTNINKKGNEFYKPYSYIIPTKQVLDFAENEYCVYVEKDFQKTRIIKVLTTVGLYACTKNNDTIIITDIVIHNIGKLPAWKLGGIPIEIQEKQTLFDSFISGMLPDLDAAAQDVSDFQAEKVQHVFSTMWYFSGQECNNCHGTGKVQKQGKQTVCPTCEGVGALRKSPYKDMMIKQPDKLSSDIAMPTPPAGYITKPTEMVKIMEGIIENDIYNALSAINFEFLADTPLNQSGKAKEVDRDELNTFVYSVAYNFVENIIKPVYYFIAEWRYKDFIGNPEIRKKMMPTIPIPERFEVLTESIVSEQLSKAYEKGFSTEAIINLEIDYMNKRFNNSPEILERMTVKRTLDPLFGKKPDEKQALQITGSVPEKDFIISTYIDNFLTRAIIENDKFLTLDYAEQMKKINQYAEEKIKETKASEKVNEKIKEYDKNGNAIKEEMNEE